MRRTDEAVEEFQRATDLNPNFAGAHGYLGVALALGGRSDQAIPHLEQAIRMSPHDPQNAAFNMAIACAHYLAGRYNEAISFGRKALQERQGWTGAHRIYIASLAQAGQIDEARCGAAAIKGITAECLYCVDRAKRPLYARPNAKIPRRHAQGRAEINPRFGLVIQDGKVTRRAMSAIGTKRTPQSDPQMSAFGGKVDMVLTGRRV